MPVDNFQSILVTLLDRRPFRLFTIELHGGKRLQVGHPHAVCYQGGAAMIWAPGGVPIVFDHESVNNFVDAPVSSAAGPADNREEN
jgi:hypothetical protein